ncbi:MAG: cytochrome P450 [Myxococcales bacterium]|nr:cytochrome P450 [Myxococcales bacterium]
MTNIPRTAFPDATIPVLRHGYEAIGRYCDQLNSDVFQTRLFLKRVICLRGEKCARLFYDTARFTRVGVAPRRVRKTLFGDAGVQSLDGETHSHRKQLFLSLVSPERIDDLEDHWLHVQAELLFAWARSEGPVVLLSSLEVGLMRAACRWLGIPLEPREEARRTDDVVGMIEGAGGVGERYLRGRLGRLRGESWIQAVIEKARASGLRDGSPLAEVANHRELDGSLLDSKVAAVELLNVLRPIVAVSRFGMFAALALYRQPTLRESMHDDVACEWFVEEVRRFYPFFPFVAAKVREAFSWREMEFPRGCLTLLDLYGTNHDSEFWGDPHVFRPSRFASHVPQPFQPIPQGGGDVAQNHRCPGEGIARRLTMSVARLLTTIDYSLPEQDLQIRMNRMPARVESGFVMDRIRWRARTRARAPEAIDGARRTDAVHRVLDNIAGWN